MALVTGLFAAAGLGCGGDDAEPDTRGAQPNAVGEDFGSDALAGIPLPVEADPVSAPSVTDGVVAQSFTTPGTPRDVMREFEAALPEDGWEPAEGPRETGAGFRAEWLRDGEVLEVSTTPFEASSDGEGAVTQFSLVLRTS